MATDLSSHYVLLDANGTASTVNGGDAFWSQSPDELDRFGRGWLVSEYAFSKDWPQWEMHPEADEIVRLIAERAMYVKDAARFKRDAFQVSAPARQAQVFDKARALAERHNRGFANLEQVVDATYRAMVAAFIANEQTYFNTMKDVGDKHE